MVIYIKDLRTRMTKNNQSTGGQSRARPLVYPEIFHGDGSLTNSICHFESVSAVNGWSDDDKILWLLVRRWQMHVWRIVDCLMRPSMQQLYKVEYESRQRRNKESQADFADDLLLLASKVFPSLQDEARGVSSKQILRPA